MVHRIFMILFVVLLTGCQMNLPSSQSLPKETHPLEKKVKTMNQQLISSAEKGETDNVLKLLKEGAEINTTDRHGRTAVMVAIITQIMYSCMPERKGFSKLLNLRLMLVQIQHLRTGMEVQLLYLLQNVDMLRL